MSTVHPVEVEYPESDGKPMAETPVHRDNMIGLIDVLQHRYAGDPMVYVSGNMFLYYERGNPKKCVAPDVFLARAARDKYRGVYKTWEEAGGPELVIEVTSPSTSEEDLEEKFLLYQDALQVPEYFLWDPLGEYLDPPLRGYRLVDGRYVAIEPVDGRLPSAVLGLHFEADGMMLRLYDPATDQTLLTSPEAREIAERARQEAERARQDEARARQEAERARQDEARARQEAELALQSEAIARLKAEQEVERLRLELEKLRRPAREANHQPPDTGPA